MLRLPLVQIPFCTHRLQTLERCMEGAVCLFFRPSSSSVSIKRFQGCEVHPFQTAGSLYLTGRTLHIWHCFASAARRTAGRRSWRGAGGGVYITCRLRLLAFMNARCLDTISPVENSPLEQKHCQDSMVTDCFVLKETVLFCFMVHIISKLISGLLSGMCETFSLALSSFALPAAARVMRFHGTLSTI